MPQQANCWFALVVLALVCASCTSVDLPRRGFVTRYFAGSYLQDSVRTTDDFAGRPLRSAIDSYVGAPPAGVAVTSGSPSMSASMARTMQTCQLAARQRASDGEYQGFSETTQKAGFDSTNADRISWRSKH